LKKLSALYIANNQITDLTPLAEIAKLSSLDLAGNKVVDLKPIENIASLSLLKLSGNEVVDLAPLGKQTQLRMLFIDKNKITDLTPLVTVCKADADGKKNFAPYLRLFMKDNPLSDAAKGPQTDALKAIGVRLEMP
jgi:internalin A